jgi:hypothetical protein
MGALRLWVHLFVDALGHCSGSISTAAKSEEFQSMTVAGLKDPRVV